MLTGQTAEEVAADAAELLNAGREADAVERCRQVIGRPDFNLAAADTALWVAATAGAKPLAIEIARAAVTLAPLDAERQRTAASVLANARMYAEAVPFAAAASELAPSDFECLFLLGVVRNEAGRHTEALRSLLGALKVRPDHAEAYHQLAVASQAIGHLEPATKLARQAFRLEPASASRAMFAAHLLRKSGQADDAIAVLQEVEPAGREGAYLLRNLSDCLFVAGRFPEALAAITGALALAPDHPEFLLFRASLLARIGNHDEAALGADAALAGNPDDLNARRHAVTLYLEGGQYERAIQHTAELLRRVPDNSEYASCMLHVLSARSEASVPLPDIAQRKRTMSPRTPRPPPRAADRLRQQARITGALMLREMRTRFGESRLGYLWVLVEMGIHLGVLAIVFQFMMHGQPPMGGSFFFFYFTGLTPYLLFLHTSEHAGHGIVQNRHMLQLPMINNFNVILSRGLLELFTQLVITGIFVVGFLMFGVNAVPADVGQASAALGVAWLLGLGFGIISAVLNAFTHVWHHVFSVVLRVLYFCSGIFYVPGLMPVPIRDVLAWNPLLHCVDWFRTTFFVNYQPYWLNREYAVAASLSIVLLGLLLEAAFRRQLRQPA